MENGLRTAWNLCVDSIINSLGPLRRWRLHFASKYRQLGIDAYRAGNISQAIIYMQKAIDKAPRSPEFHCDLGQIYYELGDYFNAEREFKKALKYDYNNARAQKGLGFSLQAVDRPVEAAYVYLRYLQQDEKDVDVLVNLGAAFMDSRNYIEALRSYGRAEKLDPKNPIIPENRGRALYAMGKIEEAIGSFRQALALDSQNAETLRFLGSAFEAKGDKGEALECYLASAKQDPTNGATHLLLAELLGKMARHREAIDHAQVAAKILRAENDWKGLSSALWELGWDQYKLGNLTDSVQASTEALKLDPKLFPVRFNLGLAYLLQGHREDALVNYSRGLEDIHLASDVQFWAIDDLREIMENRPEMPGGREILQILEDKYEDLKKGRGVRYDSKTSKRNSSANQSNNLV
jgi:tetratricopeptide (TPR) repeat protein